MDDVYPAYEALWNRARAEGAAVRYEGTSPNGEAGWFHPTHYPKPTIVLVRPYYKSSGNQPSRDSNAPPPLAQPDIHAELITLAHEYGHFRSWAGRTERAEYELYEASAKRRDTLFTEERDRLPDELPLQGRWDRLRAVMHAGLDNDARARIVREETLAWVIGREVLAELGLEDFTLYDEHTRRGLHIHRYRLGIDELWPEDV